MSAGAKSPSGNVGNEPGIDSESNSAVLHRKVRMEEGLVKRVAERYASVGARMYARGKLGSDPVATQLLELGHERALGHVVDVGAGRDRKSVV